ncbi:hypothetical protein DKX38_011884 [Salix brachista]|uniref:peptidylprolyl isomerase n=1 Tax=Salix brachista TaxID=2182728 RepID=A0A5N5M0P2_9ROSI|nr:hypothetical protein DKX38_011884 [Salix brachista]
MKPPRASEQVSFIAMDVTRGAKSAKWHAGSSSGKTTKSHGTINVFDKVQEDGYWSDEEKRSCNGAGIGVSSLCNIGSFDDIAKAAGLPPEEKPGLCDENLEKELAKAWLLLIMLPWFHLGKFLIGMKGAGESCQLWWVFGLRDLDIVCLSLEKRQLYIFRVGSDQMIKGLGEGILSMKVGGKRRLYIPGPVIYPHPTQKNVDSCRMLAKQLPWSSWLSQKDSLQLLDYIPGLEVEEE